MTGEKDPMARRLTADNGRSVGQMRLEPACKPVSLELVAERGMVDEVDLIARQAGVVQVVAAVGMSVDVDEAESRVGQLAHVGVDVAFLLLVVGHIDHVRLEEELHARIERPRAARHPHDIARGVAPQMGERVCERHAVLDIRRRESGLEGLSEDVVIDADAENDRVRRAQLVVRPPHEVTLVDAVAAHAVGRTAVDRRPGIVAPEHLPLASAGRSRREDAVPDDHQPPGIRLVRKGFRGKGQKRGQAKESHQPSAASAKRHHSTFPC